MSLYSFLELNPNATEEEIKKAYRRMSLKYHPDKNKDKTLAQNYLKIKEAYDILGDYEKRRQYDSVAIISVVQQQQQQQKPEPVPQPSHPIQQHNLIVKTLSVPIKMAFEGGQLPIQIERWVNYYETVTVYVDIYEGIDDNELIILKGQGHQGGDVKIFVKIVNTTEYVRSGLDLVFSKTITLKEALCGFSFELKLLNDKVLAVNNRRGNIISPSFEKILPNMGMRRDARCGSLIIRFHIEFPTYLSPTAMESLENLL